MLRKKELCKVVGFINLTIIFIWVATSCSKSDEENVINPLQENSSAFTCKETLRIPLSNDSMALIGSINNIEIYYDRVYLLDLYQINGVSIFSNTGEFIFRTVRGKGPGELVFPFSFNLFNDTLMISDPQMRKYFSLTGRYIGMEKLPLGFFARKYVYLPEGKTLTYGSSPILGTEPTEDYSNVPIYRYHLLNRELNKELNHFIPTTIDWSALECDKPISIYKNHILLLAPPGNIIYELQDTSIYEKYIVDFGDYNITEAEIKKGKFEYARLLRDKSRYGFIDYINETKRFITFSYYFTDGDILFSIYSKKTKKCADFYKVLKKSGFPPMNPVGTYEDDLICIFMPAEFPKDELDDFIKSGKIPKGTNQESNPIIYVLSISEK